MGNVIKIKHGDTAPTVNNLENYELGYADKGLYIKDNNQIVKLNDGANLSGIVPIAHGGTNANSAAGARQNLGLGSLATANSISLSSNSVTNTLPITKGGTGATNASAARTNLGLGSLATVNSISLSSSTLTGTLPITKGGTGATSIANARTNLGLGSLATESSISLSSSTLTGVLPLTKGGTGRTTLNTASDNAILKKNSGVDSIGTIQTLSGALYATGTDAAPVFGTLPTNQGGTGISVASRSGLLDSLCDDSDTGWVSLTRSTNWGGESDYFVYRKIGPMVEMRFYLVAATTTSDSGPWLLASGLPASAQPRNYTIRSTSSYHNGNPMTIVVNYYGSENAARVQVHGRIYNGYACWGQVMYFI